MVEVFWPGESSPGGSGTLPGGIPGERRSGYVQAIEESLYRRQPTLDELAGQSFAEVPATPAKSGPEELAVMEATAAEAHEAYYEVGGTGYGTTPGGPDVYYFDYGQTQPTVYEQGTFLGRDLPGKDDLLLYGALAIGALALLKR